MNEHSENKQFAQLIVALEPRLTRCAAFLLDRCRAVRVLVSYPA